MVILVDDDRNSSLWVPRDAEEGYDSAESDEPVVGLWRHSLDPKSEPQHMPTEYQSWERWSNHFHKEQGLRLLAFDL
jgi:hypothetical protein